MFPVGPNRPRLQFQREGPRLRQFWWKGGIQRAVPTTPRRWFHLQCTQAKRTSTKAGWVAVKKSDLEGLPVLDIRQVSPAQLLRLSELFDEMAVAEFERLPRMAGCQARSSLDAGVSRILGLPDLGTLRTLLASEPVVSNRRV